MEYHRSRNRFLLLYNTKYDAYLLPGQHHPRTRFSIAHELGHYFLEPHRAYLRRTGKSHPSKGEFLSDRTIEMEADAFAAGLLMPSALLPYGDPRLRSPGILDVIAGVWLACRPWIRAILAKR